MFTCRSCGAWDKKGMPVAINIPLLRSYDPTGFVDDNQTLITEEP